MSRVVLRDSALGRHAPERLVWAGVDHLALPVKLGARMVLPRPLERVMSPDQLTLIAALTTEQPADRTRLSWREDRPVGPGQRRGQRPKVQHRVAR